MAAITVTKIQMPFVTERQLPKATIDPLTKDDFGEAIRYIADLGDTPGYASQAAPVNGTAITDLSAQNTSGGQIVVGAGQNPGFAGGGLQMTGITAVGTYISLPAAINASIYAPYNGLSQLFAAVAYVKLPSAANWMAQSGIMPIFDFGGQYNVSPDLLTVGMQSGGALSFRRQISAGTVESTSYTLTLKSADYGSVVQIAYWRNQDGQFARLRSLNGITWSVNNPNGNLFAKGVDNTQNFSGLGPRFGWASFGSGTAPNGLNGLRLYRFIPFNLARDNRNMPTWLDQDFTRTMARGVYS